jgi:hypothetical protein
MKGSVEVAGRRRRRSKQVLDDLKEKEGYWKLEEVALDRTVWTTGIGRDDGHVVRETTGRENIY